MTAISGTHRDNHEPLGETLARLRRLRKLTGGQLGKLVGLSQPTISRLENGVGLPDPDHVTRIARALGVDEYEIRHLRAMAELAHDRMTDWRPLPSSLAMIQRRVGAAEGAARMLRMFQPVMVPGLLQTSEYARAVMSSLDSLTSEEAARFADSAAVLEAVSARMRRQEILADQARTFEFVIAEAALSNRICAAEHMPAQIRRLKDIARQDNVSISFVLADAPWRVPPIHGFDLLDEHAVTVDMFNTGLTSVGRTDAQLYRQMFDAFAEQATTDIDPILDRYLEMYLDLARPSRRSS